jgi:hypothetical protein
MKPTLRPAVIIDNGSTQLYPPLSPAWVEQQLQEDGIRWERGALLHNPPLSPSATHQTRVTAKGIYLAQHSAGLMADHNLFIGPVLAAHTA